MGVIDVLWNGFCFKVIIVVVVVAVVVNTLAITIVIMILCFTLKIGMQIYNI
jgi:hypothetical protein